MRIGQHYKKFEQSSMNAFAGFQKPALLPASRIK